MDFFKKRRDKILARARRREVEIQLSERINHEQNNLVGTADEQFKNQCDGIKSLAEAQKALAEVDLTESKNRSETLRGVGSLVLGAAKLVVSSLILATVYGLESSGGWFSRNKESAGLARDEFRDATRDTTPRF